MKARCEQILGQLLRKHPKDKLYVATKIPPKNFIWPSRSTVRLEDCFPASHIIEYTEKSLKNLDVECIDLQQFHVWEDSWSDNDEWKGAIEKLKKEGKIRHIGISVNRWEPDNVLSTLKTGPDRYRPGHLQYFRPGTGRQFVPTVPQAGYRCDRKGSL